MNSIIRKEFAGDILGVPARFFGVVAADDTGRILNQSAKATRAYTENGNRYQITVGIRFDDQCHNGHETFAITADILENGREYMSGCCHNEIVTHFPEFEPLIKWHLTSTDGPLHYIANTIYHAKNGDIDYARASAVWPDATTEQLLDKAALESRLPSLIGNFKADMLSIGFLFPQSSEVTA